MEFKETTWLGGEGIRINGTRSGYSPEDIMEGDHARMHQSHEILPLQIQKQQETFIECQ